MFDSIRSIGILSSGTDTFLSVSPSSIQQECPSPGTKPLARSLPKTLDASDCIALKEAILYVMVYRFVVAISVHEFDDGRLSATAANRAQKVSQWTSSFFVLQLLVEKEEIFFYGGQRNHKLAGDNTTLIFPPLSAGTP